MAYELKSTIHSNQFMIIAMDNDSKEFFAKPTVYTTYAQALHEAQSLARKYWGIKYIVVAVAAIAETSTNPVVTTGYRL